MSHPEMLGDWRFQLGDQPVTGAVTSYVGYEECPLDRTRFRAYVDLLVHVNFGALSYQGRQEIADQAHDYVVAGFQEYNRTHPGDRVKDAFIVIYVTDRSDTQ